MRKMLSICSHNYWLYYLLFDQQSILLRLPIDWFNKPNFNGISKLLLITCILEDFHMHSRCFSHATHWIAVQVRIIIMNGESSHCSQYRIKVISNITCGWTQLTNRIRSIIWQHIFINRHSWRSLRWNTWNAASEYPVVRQNCLLSAIRESNYILIWQHLLHTVTKANEANLIGERGRWENREEEQEIIKKY